jgi:hypothetical protein
VVGGHTIVDKEPKYGMAVTGIARPDEIMTNAGARPGDALVLTPSASGQSRTRRIPFRAEHGVPVGRAHHLALLNHPAVYERLREWLTQSPSQALRPPSSDQSTGKNASSSSRSPGRR